MYKRQEEGLPDSIAMDADEAVRRTDSLYDRFHGRDNLKVYYSLRALNSCSNRLVELEAAHARAVSYTHLDVYKRQVHGIHGGFP